MSTPPTQAFPGAEQHHTAPVGGGAPWAAPGPFCRFCGSVPAVEATIRGHQGFLVIMKFLKLKGPFCRPCGVAVHRKMTADSLWQGWWGIASAVINPVTMLVNLPQRAKINKLGAPVPGAPGRPADPGKPLYRRPAILGLLIPVIAVGLIAFQAGRDPSYAEVGDCVHNKNVMTAGVSDTHPDVVVLSCSDPDADARIVGKVSGTANGDSACEAYADADGWYTQEEDSRKFTLCLHFLK
ncbi:hypothetical protein [Kitasatospora herbaricolor]|uniref:Toxin-antitoxin system, toxin component n=1 Tax=Kitasatospora herbaricolor TaxID=68217 RepID=A0ABZ1WJ38_9ACTN|nr:hypothetical protein [Kitasatospora herbaricolor]